MNPFCVCFTGGAAFPPPFVAAVTTETGVPASVQPIGSRTQSRFSAPVASSTALAQSSEVAFAKRVTV